MIAGVGILSDSVRVHEVQKYIGECDAGREVFIALQGRQNLLCRF